MSLFITGTGTSIGKTLVCGLMARYLKERGERVVTQKFIQTGSQSGTNDVFTHWKIMGENHDTFQRYLGLICPYQFPFPASPHLAAKKANQCIDPLRLKTQYYALLRHFDYVLVEGTGGWRVPITETHCLSEVVSDMSIPLIVVVGNYLGALHHALSTLDSISKTVKRVIGVIMTDVDDTQDPYLLEDNYHTLSRLSSYPILGRLQHSNDIHCLYRQFLPIGDRVMRQLRISPEIAQV